MTAPRTPVEISSTAGALGSGTLTAFLWNGFLVPHGAPEMDAVVAPAAGAALWGALSYGLRWLGMVAR